MLSEDKDHKMDQEQVHDEMEHEVVKSPGAQLLERLADHHEKMIKGVESFMPAFSLPRRMADLLKRTNLVFNCDARSWV